MNHIYEDPRYFHPAEVETLLGDPTKAKQKLVWLPEISVQEIVRLNGGRGSEGRTGPWA